MLNILIGNEQYQQTRCTRLLYQAWDVIKTQKMSEIGEIYTAACSDGMDKSHLCLVSIITRISTPGKPGKEKAFWQQVQFWRGELIFILNIVIVILIVIIVTIGCSLKGGAAFIRRVSYHNDHQRYQQSRPQAWKNTKKSQIKKSAGLAEQILTWLNNFWQVG